MSETTVFHKILAGEIPSDRIHEDEHCVVIKDINPVAPVHLLCIPKKFIRDISTAEGGDQALLGHLLLTAAEVAKKSEVTETGFRIVVNCGDDGGLEVPYLHVHVIGGKKLPSLG